jgi:endo-1,4-beta-xylanase
VKFRALYQLVSVLKVSGVPIDGVGLQSHFIVGRVPQGLPAVLPATAESLIRQAADYRFVVKACLRVARCVGVTTWGISDDHSWIPRVFSGYGDALLFDRRGDPKPAYAAVIAALHAAPKIGYREH